MLYHQGFDVSLLSAGTLTVATSGKTSAAITLASAVTGTDNDTGASSSLFWMYAHASGDYKIRGEDPSQTTRVKDFAREGFTDALQTALRARMAAVGWAGDENDFDVTISATTGAVTFTYDATFTLAWSTAVGRTLVGFSGNQSGASTYTSDQTPDYIIVPTLSATSLDTPNYEPANVANHLIADDGSGYGFSRSVSPLYRDWVQQYEVKAKTLRLAAASAHPNTFQAFIEGSRGEYPFIVADGFGNANDECFSFRSEGTSAQIERATVANDNQFHIPFRCVVEGEVVAV